MAVQQLIWIVLIGAVLIAGFPVKSPDTVNEEDRLNYEKYVRQLEKKHKFAYNDIDQPWQPISDDDSAQDDSHEIVLKLEDSVSVQPLVKDNVKLTSQSPVVAADQAPVTPVVKAEETHAVPVIKTEEVPVVAPVTKAEETPAAPVIKTEEAPVVAPVITAEETPAAIVIKAEETPALPATEAVEASVVATAVTKAEDVPAVAVTKVEETRVIAPVNEAEKEQQVADAISETVAAVAEDEVATTTHEKLLVDNEDDVPATTTHDKLLGVADEVEGSGQSDAVAEVESVTVSQANEPIEDSTFSAFKTELVEESVTKVADDANEGSGQLVSDSVTQAADEGSGGQPLSDSADEGSGQLLSDSADVGSGGQPLIDNTSADEGSGVAADIAEGSGLAEELVKEVDHTIQPEILNEESSTGTQSDLHLKDDLAFDSPSTTTESLTTDLVNEKEVKSTDTPTADEVATTEIQPSPTIKSAQAEDSTEVVMADSTDVNDFRQVSAATFDSTDRPVEDTTFVNVPVNDEILAEEAILKNTTEKPDDSHSTPSVI